MKTRNLLSVIILSVLLLIYAGVSLGPCVEESGRGPFIRQDLFRQTTSIVPDGSGEAADSLPEYRTDTFGLPAKLTIPVTLIELLLLWLLPHPFFRIPGLLLHCFKSLFTAYVYQSGVLDVIPGPSHRLTAYGKGVMVLAAVIAVGYVVQFALDIRSRRAAR